MSAPARPAIQAAWHRAAMAGLRHETTPNPERAFDIEPDSRLLVAARPVLDQLASELSDTRFALILADRQARVVDYRVAVGRLQDRLAEVGLTTGTVWDEEQTGTNAVATTFELRRGLSVVGDEHYLDDLKQFCCYGEPLFDPTSGRLEGVLDITGPVGDATPLLGPFLSRARHEIEARLLDTSRATHQRLLRAYEAATQGARHPVLGIGEDMLLANRSATAELTRDDIAVLRAVAGSGVAGSTSVRLATGATARIDCEPVMPGAAVLRVRPAPTQLATAVATGTAGRLPRRTNISTLVCGEPGTGRTAEARRRGGDAATVLCAHDAVDIGESAWSEAVRTAFEAGGDVMVDDVHLLSSRGVDQLRRLLAGGRRPGRIVATSHPLPGLSTDQQALAALFDDHVVLLPLRDDRARISRLVTAMLAEAAGEDGPRASGALLDHLTQFPWPGNLHELQAVVQGLAASPSGRELTIADLPARYRPVPWQRSLSPLERSEYDTIVVALRDCDGNKVRAARQLGISRGTLYSRMRRFKITA